MTRAFLAWQQTQSTVVTPITLDRSCGQITCQVACSNDEAPLKLMLARATRKSFGLEEAEARDTPRPSSVQNVAVPCCSCSKGIVMRIQASCNALHAEYAAHQEYSSQLLSCARRARPSDMMCVPEKGKEGAPGVPPPLPLPCVARYLLYSPGRAPMPDKFRGHNSPTIIMNNYGALPVLHPQVWPRLNGGLRQPHHVSAHRGT